MSLPLPVILQELESSPSSIIPILSTLHYDRDLLETISKPDLKHLVSRTMNLTRSNNVYNRWCGINIMKVLGGSYKILSSDGNTFISQLLTILENYNARNDPKILSSAVECLNSLCDQIRGKPTLTREVLTPKLPGIISVYLAKLDYNPYLVISSLHRLAEHHPTTFRPYGNKLRARLLEIANTKNYLNFPPSLKSVITRTVATLPAIEKTEPDAKWASDVSNLIKEVTQVLLIYKEFLNLADDEELTKLINSLPQGANDESNLFPPLKIDVNDYASILQISNRVEVLLDLLKGYLITKTQFSVKVPIGSIIVLNEVICSINTKFVSFKRELRDETVRKLLETTLLINQKNSISLLHELPAKYKGNVIPHISNILSFLETLIPFKNRKINYTEVLVNENFMCELLICVARYISLVKEFNDNSVLIRFVEVALFLVEPRLASQEPIQTKKQQQQQQNGKKNKNKKKSHGSVPLADILSHQHLFNESIPQETTKVFREFINAVITRVDLPPTQHYKIMRYVLIEAVKTQTGNYDAAIPAELRTLLVNSVLYPTNENVSLLPLISTIIGNDPIISVFNNPRFPPLPVYINKSATAEAIEESDEDEDEDEDEEQSTKRRADDDVVADTKRPRTTTFSASGEAGDGSDATASSVGVNDIEIKEDPQNDKLFKSVPIKPEQIIQFANAPEQSIKQSIEQSTEQSTTSEVEPVIETKVVETVVTELKDDDSDFEMPELDAGDSDDDE